jgi:hypothetical protein
MAAGASIGSERGAVLLQQVDKASIIIYST